ncbi:hypothetical protein LG272_04440 [Pseudidiomarina marina]|uniref:Uncharacterized protein n=1 Tax=Pseudidiomarina marina TaxID=502366 RepID=A0A432YD69_9GAMM|nr:hypothetical protein [Pseudidiomarina marina]PHR65787.1 MAG: hypothetical protein COA51_04615 [Idiomarina sp.]RUO58881.1 hypothetical protein CWI76_10575 [Pseudidiomarina marina]
MTGLRVTLSVVCLSLLINGCTYRGAYQEMQREQLRQCVEEQGIPYHECLERTNKSYDEYMRERQEVINNQ